MSPHGPVEEHSKSKFHGFPKSLVVRKHGERNGEEQRGNNMETNIQGLWCSSGLGLNFTGGLNGKGDGT